MIPDPDLIHYACIAKGTTVLAEFNSRDAALGSVAARCLANTPPFHATFTHTVRSRTHAFLIDGFVYFAVFDERLEPPDGLAFLRTVRDSFERVADGGKRKLENLKSHCFQGEFNPVFRQLLGSGPAQMEGIGSPRGHRLSEMQNGSSPVCERARNEKGLKKMKNRLLGGFEKEEGGEDGSNNGLSREFPLISKNGGGGGGLYSGEITGHQRAKRVWRKQVWVILLLDFAVCVIFFAVWLWVCEGFKCIES